MYNAFFESEIGLLEVVSDEENVLEIRLKTKKTFEKTHAICLQAIDQLKAYFAKERKVFNIPFKLNGTNFQNRVWQELIKIPFGEVVSYQELAKRIGNPKAVRAVGSAVGANPLLILLPCHRIIGTNNTLTGFSAGLENKIKLLIHEGFKLNTHHSIGKTKVVNNI